MSWDERQLAMLREMGLTAWTPRDAAPAEDASAEAAAPEPPPAAPPAYAAAEHAPLGVQEDSFSYADEPGPAAPEPGRRPAGIGQMDWPALRAAVAGCTACKLCSSRRNPVFGVGNEQARWMIVGEAPGEQEDRKGEPFVGPAGKLLDNMLAAIGLTRSEAPPERQVFIANVLKCRPPQNRNPQPEEIAQCEHYLKRQIELAQPRIILAMGRFAVQSLLQSQDAIGRLRGRVHRYRDIPVIVTYHPAYLLRNLPDKARSWEDLCLALDTFRQQG